MKVNVYYRVRVQFNGGPSPGLKRKLLERIADLLDSCSRNGGVYDLPGVEQHYVTQGKTVRRKRRA